MVKACQMSFMIAPPKKRNSYAARWEITFVMRKTFFFWAWKTKIEVNCRVNWWWTVPKIHCVMQQMKNFHLDSGRSQIYSKAFWQAVHHAVKSRKLIYNLFSLFNLFSFAAYIFQQTSRSLFNNFSIWLMGCQDKSKKGCEGKWKRWNWGENIVMFLQVHVKRKKKKWFNIQNAVYAKKSLINHSSGLQVQEDQKKSINFHFFLTFLSSWSFLEKGGVNFWFLSGFKQFF